MPPSLLPKFFFISIISATILAYSHSQSVDDQKTLLLQLKNELIFISSISTKLVQWNQMEDCCKWYGVGCDEASNVISLQLDHESIYGGIGDSSSLFRLKYLQKLNLAYNEINYTPIPKGISNLTYLTHLNLSNAAFGGQVPLELTFLTRLVSLDISNDWEFRDLSLEYPNLEMLLQNLTGLRELYLDRAFISSDEKTKWSHIISSYLPNLTSLSLRHCFLSGPVASSFWQLHSLSILRLDHNDLSTEDPDSLANFSNLSTLSLVNCGLNGSFPNMIFHIPTLRILHLSHNHLLSGSIPTFTQTGSLNSLVVSFTQFSGSIPSTISNLKALWEIDLSFCHFTGSIPSTFANLTELIYVDLRSNSLTSSLSSALFERFSNLLYLHLEFNSFSGSIPHSLFGLPSLLKLHLSNNQFTGQVEEFPIANVSNIVSLDLTSNRLEGPIPDSFFQLQSLEFLSLSENLFNGSFQLDKIQRLANLTQLDLSHNNLTVDVGNDNSSTHGLSQLKELRLASCNLYDFPDFIRHFDMRVLDLSNNRIAGEIPTWIWGTQLEELDLSFNLFTDVQKPHHIPASLRLLDLHSNRLMGELHLLIPPNIENLTSNLEYLLLANNSLSGSIPTSLCSATYLEVLNLSVNKLSGSIPPCLLENTTRLSVIDLGRNNISGPIPDNFSPFCNLQYLDLNNNTLEGKLPKSFESCKLLEFMNVGNNIINDSFPCMLSSSLRVLVLHSNRFHGEVKCHNMWPDLQIVDISSNNFSGSLESMNFSSWRAMVLGSDAQLRHNNSGYYYLWSFGVTLIMKGLGMQFVKIWPEFNAIDFSCNNFHGEIPNAVGDLSSLHHLNFSHNALNGSIPKSFGQLRELESLDLSQNQLTGTIPMELAWLAFLQVLDLSYNKLTGGIPNDPHFQTFSADSFKGNVGLCGFNLNISCIPTNGKGLSPPGHENEEEKREIEWEYVSTALGYVVGLGSFVWLLLFCRSFRVKYFGKVDEVVEEILDGRNRRRRRRARRALRDRVRRQ